MNDFPVFDGLVSDSPVNYCRICPCLLVRRVDQFERQKTPPNQLNMAPCQLGWQEPKFAGLKMNLKPAWQVVFGDREEKGICDFHKIRDARPS